MLFGLHIRLDSKIVLNSASKLQAIKRNTNSSFNELSKPNAS